MKRFLLILALVLAASSAQAQTVPPWYFIEKAWQEASGTQNIIPKNASFTFAGLSSKPNTISGFGIINGAQVVASGSIVVANGAVNTDIGFALGGDPNIYLVVAYVQGDSLDSFSYGFTYSRYDGAHPSNCTSLYALGGTIAFGTGGAGIFRITTTCTNGSGGTLLYSVIKLSNL